MASVERLLALVAGRELIIVLTGVLRMEIGDQKQTLATGDSPLFNANVRHVYENPGNSDARYHDILIYSLRRARRSRVLPREESSLTVSAQRRPAPTA